MGFVSNLTQEKALFFFKSFFFHRGRTICVVTICGMQLIVVVGVLICRALLVSVGSSSIGMSRQDFPQFQDQDLNDTLDMADSPELGRAATSSYLKYKGFTVGCHNKYCFRYKWKDSSRWGWIEDWDYKPGGKKRQYVPCKNHQYCLNYVKQRHRDFPCYASKWSEFHCYKGRRFGCSNSYGCSYPERCCWYETLKAPYYWDWAFEGTIGNPLLCGKNQWDGG